MAFDLLKLQLLQEALEAQKFILRTQVELLENRNEKLHRFAYLGICSALKNALKQVCNINPVGSWDVDFLVPEVSDIITRSLIGRLGLLNIAMEEHPKEVVDEAMARAVGYLWPKTAEYQAARVRYLERLIEDEMSGTYFMGATIGL